MTLSQAKHAEQVVNRFRQMVAEAGDTLTDAHYQELNLLVEAALDAVIVQQLDTFANQLEQMAQAVRRDGDFFSRS
ncbi:MAG: hypothetical protein KDK04_04655 [Candidatus Competibacteraceae bacterium]|nr:hypothetical protein [Candidatus Competibacteraceae bacterium]MCB1809264.1 hypothetical protein [Candidatus Competibacteraceae bacterium]MCB1811000.1 hypothetical protein [Candidatus Competibacteraceae bacterium]